MLRKSLILVSCLFVLALAIIGCGGGGGSAGNPTGPALVSATTASLSGTVLFNNTPIPFASVHLYKSEKAHTVGMAQLPSLKGSLLSQQIIGNDAYSTTTNAEGVYNFVNIPVGQYTLIAVRDENHQFVQTGVLLGQVTTLNPQLTPTGKITGKVTLSIGGTPQDTAGAFVYINGTSYIAVSDTAGNFTINNVPSNALTTSAAYEILVSSTRGTASPVTGVVVNPGATTNIGTIAMTAPAQAMYTTLNGTLVPGKGVSGVGGLFVVLTHQTSGSIFGTHTDASGNYQFRVVESGNFLVICTESDYNFTPDPLVVQIDTPNNTTLTLSPITVDAGQVAETGSIIGTVVSFGSPFAGAIVHITGTSLLGISNSSGNFIINNVPVNTSANSYTLELSANKGTAQAKTGVVVNVGQATDVGAFDITEPTTGYKNVVGTLTAVTPVTAADLVNRLVQLTGPDGKVLAAYSDVNGAFSFMVTQVGNHSATVIDTGLAYAPRTQSINVGVLDNATQGLTSTISASMPNIDNKLRVAGFVSKVIKVKPETDNSGVSLKLDPEAAIATNLYTFSRADGSFEFFVVPGTYTLSVEGLYQLNPPSPLITINISNPYTFASPIAVRPAQTVNSIVAGSVTWPTITDWNFSEGEVILEGVTFVDRRIVSNVSPASFRFENVPPGNYVLKSNPLRNGYAGATAAFVVAEGTDVFGQTLVTTFVAPLINTTTPANDSLTVSGSNFGTVMANLETFVNDKSGTFTSLADTSVTLNIAQVPPGDNVVQLVKILPEGRVVGNKKLFTRPILAPAIAGFIASSTDTSITFTWQNAPYINEVDIRLLHGAAEIRPFQRIVGNSFTYEKLLPGVTYTIVVVSTYPNLANSAPTAFNFTTKTDGINNIGLFALSGALSGDQIIDFEVDNNVGFVCFYNSSLGEITLQSFDMLTNTASATRTIPGSNGANSSNISLAANSTGVFLTYRAPDEDDVISCFNRDLNSVIASKSLTIAAPAGLGLVPDSFRVRRLNNRIFLVAKNNADVRVRELNSSLTVLSQHDAAAAGGTFVDITHDSVTQKIYLTHSESTQAVVKAFNGMDITTSPSSVGSFSGGTFYSTYASNNQIYLVKESSGIMADAMDARSGYVRSLAYSSPGSFGFDKQNRIWTNVGSPMPVFMQLDEALNQRQTLKIPNPGNMTGTLSRIKLDIVTGMMYMLHFNVNNALAVYRYNSNY